MRNTSLRQNINCSSNLILRYTFFLFVLCIQYTNAQQLFWQHMFNPGGQDWASGVAIDTAGNIIVVGSTDPTSIDPNDHGDFLTIKYNPQGDTLWTRRLNVSAYDIATGVAVGKSGNIIVVGETRTDKSTYGSIQIVKYNVNGDTLWTRRYGRPNEENWAANVIIDSKENIIIIGRQRFVPPDYLTLKYDSVGTLLWERRFDGGWEDNAADVAVDDFDNVIVTGFSDSNINWDWATVKYTADGDSLWVKRFNTAIDEWASGVATDKGGNIVVVGFTTRINRNYGAVVKYNTQGDTLWTRVFTNTILYADTIQFSRITNFTDITTDIQGNIYLAGNLFYGDTLGNWYHDYYIIKCDTLGDTLWTYRFNYDNDDEPIGIAVDNLGNIVVTGTTNHSTGMQDQNYLTIKLKDISTSVKIHNKGLQPSFFLLDQNYPNPFNPSTTISYSLPTDGFVSLKVYDILGRDVQTLINEFKPAGKYEASFNAQNLSSGLYFYRLELAGKSLIRKMLFLK